jgi:hypothetical protein
MERQYFYHIPESIAHPHYLQWHVDARLRRYIHQRIPDDRSSEQVVAIARILVQEVQQLHGDAKDTYTLAEQNLSGSITALQEGGRKAPRFIGGDERCCGFSLLVGSPAQLPKNDCRALARISHK